MKRGRPRSIRRKKSIKRGITKNSPKQRAAARGRAMTRRRKGR